MPWESVAIRNSQDSSDAKKQRGDDGVVREIEVLTDTQVSLLSDRRRVAPYGLAGGLPGQCGEAELLISLGQAEQLPGKFSLAVKAGDRIVIKTPGGGGVGKQESMQSSNSDRPPAI